jgi:ribosomal protein S18 acetylase RimI-like enzyme
MSGSSDPQLLRRLIDLELELERDSSDVREYDWGVLVMNSETPDMWSGNYLEVRTTDLDAAALARLADEVQGPLEGIEHRDVVPADPGYADELVAGFEALEGWIVSRSLYMVLARDPDRDAGAAREVTRAEVAGVRRAVAEADPNFTQPAVEQRLIRDGRLDAAGDGRWFAAPPDGPPGAACVLYRRAGVGQVETVVTHPEHRGQGLASAVVTAAANASRERGDELTFIVADAEDWPWKLYERLGFDRVGEFCTFLRKPPQLDSGD